MMISQTVASRYSVSHNHVLRNNQAFSIEAKLYTKVTLDD